MAGFARVNKQRLINQSIPDSNISELLKDNPKVYNAIKNLGNTAKDLTNIVFPPLPVQAYYGRIISGGVQATGFDLLVHRYHVRLPLDPTGYWKCNSITLTSCTTTLKIASVTGPYQADILVSQLHGTTVYKSLFKTGLKPTVPATFFTAHNADFAIDTLYDDDLISFNVDTADGVAAGVELLLAGSYNWTEIEVK